jgi:hypothetical protein
MSLMVIMPKRIRVDQLLRLSLCVLLLIVNAACSSEPTAIADECAESRFGIFLTRFAEDRDFQRQHTRFPLSKQMLDGRAMPEPVPVETWIEAPPADSSLFPDAARIEAESLTLEVARTDRGKLVRLKKADTDYLVKYFFEHHSCWTLVRIEDLSL